MNLALLPNLLCVLRMALAVPVVCTIVEGCFAWTLGLFFVAALTDGLDGWLANRLHCETELGKLLDPVADKLLLVSTFVTLTLTGLVPLWLTATAVARDLVIGIGAAAYRRLFGPLDGRPTWPSKANTLLQLAYVLGRLGRGCALKVFLDILSCDPREPRNDRNFCFLFFKPSFTRKWWR